MAKLESAIDGVAGQAALRRTRILSNGRYTVLADGAGGGYSAHGGIALTRWAPDPVRSQHGVWLYIRDLEAGTLWSAGHAPVRRPPDRYAVHLAMESVRIERDDDGILTRLEICVARAADAELRRLTLMNRSAGRRRLEVTSLAEIVLATAAADAAHPAFSKLFVQTGHVAGIDALIAWRRARSPDDRPVWLAHRLVAHDDDDGAPASYETDRARFLGRGRTPAQPAALARNAPLAGTAGNVLDPVFAIRRVVELEPGEQRVLTAVLATAASREEAIAPLVRFTATAEVDTAFDTALAGNPEEAAPLLGLPHAWLAQLDIAGDETEALPVEIVASVGARESAGVAMAAPRAWPDLRIRGGPPADAAPASADPEALLFFNGHGGFTADGSEYVIRLDPCGDGPARPPQPWVNVIANPSAGVIVSESGALHSWTVNSRENRLTPWSNDPVSDPHGEALYIRDDDTGAFWSPTPGPAPGAGAYEVRHGFGYTRFLHASGGLEQETRVFVARDDPIRILRLRITNRGTTPRQLSLYGYAQLVLGGLPADTRANIVTEHDAATGAIFARNPRRAEFSERVAFAASMALPAGERFATADRVAFLGEDGAPDRPAAIVAGEPLDAVVGAGLDPCVALQHRT
ncbi:MAG: hypothetical protein ACRELX_12200, partial [Longimicrobiales bacterium]